MEGELDRPGQNHLLNYFKAIHASRFSAYPSGAQGVNSGVATKVSFQSEHYDNLSEFDSAANYRFQPFVDGYYNLSAEAYYTSQFLDQKTVSIYIYKNGAELYRFNQMASGNASLCSPALSVDVYAVTTDFFEIYTYHDFGAVRNLNADKTFFTGHRFA